MPSPFFPFALSARPGAHVGAKIGLAEALARFVAMIRFRNAEATPLTRSLYRPGRPFSGLPFFRASSPLERAEPRAPARYMNKERNAFFFVAGYITHAHEAFGARWVTRGIDSFR